MTGWFWSVIAWVAWILEGHRIAVKADDRLDVLSERQEITDGDISRIWKRCAAMEARQAKQDERLEAVYTELAEAHKQIGQMQARIAQLEETSKPAEPAARRSAAAFRSLMDSGGLGIKATQ